MSTYRENSLTCSISYAALAIYLLSFAWPMHLPFHISIGILLIGMTSWGWGILFAICRGRRKSPLHAVIYQGELTNGYRPERVIKLAWPEAICSKCGRNLKEG